MSENVDPLSGPVKRSKKFVLGFVAQKSSTSPALLTRCPSCPAVCVSRDAYSNGWYCRNS